MLFVPWREEEKELINIDHEASYNELKHVVQYNKKEYVFFGNDDSFIENIQKTVYEDLLKGKFKK